jgi:NAD(P)-dependent dehydrogenase (short-subunit alcohol dehydrogenase family)
LQANYSFKSVYDELIGTALLLASDAGSFITGAELVVDGGFDAMTI